MWEQGHTAIAACNSNVSEPKRERDFGVKQTTYLAQRGEDEGLLLYRDNSTGGDNVVLPDLGGPAYHTQDACVYKCVAARLRVAEYAGINLNWLPDVGDLLQEMQTLGYEL